jgi:hypothetical protein
MLSSTKARSPTKNEPTAAQEIEKTPVQVRAGWHQIWRYLQIKVEACVGYSHQKLGFFDENRHLISINE